MASYTKLFLKGIHLKFFRKSATDRGGRSTLASSISLWTEADRLKAWYAMKKRGNKSFGVEESEASPGWTPFEGVSSVEPEREEEREWEGGEKRTIVRKG